MSIPRALLAVAILGGACLDAADDAAPRNDLRVEIRGEILHANTVEFAGLTFRDVVGQPQLAGRVLSFHDCRATAYGGTVGGEVSHALAAQAAAATLPPDAQGVPARLPPLPAPAPPTAPATGAAAADKDAAYHCTCKVSGLDLGTILHEFGGNSAGISGTIDGTLELTIPVAEPLKMYGRGEIHIVNGSMVQLPLLANLFLGDPTGNRGQDTFTATFDLRDGNIQFLTATLDSPSIQIGIRGTIRLDGDLALYLDPRFKFGIIEIIPGLGPLVVPLLAKVQRRVTRALVRGQITKPVLIINPFIKAQ
jgi:hypothetical protein